MKIDKKKNDTNFFYQKKMKIDKYELIFERGKHYLLVDRYLISLSFRKNLFE